LDGVTRLAKKVTRVAVKNKKIGRHKLITCNEC